MLKGVIYQLSITCQCIWSYSMQKSGLWKAATSKCLHKIAYHYVLIVAASVRFQVAFSDSKFTLRVKEGEKKIYQDVLFHCRLCCTWQDETVNILWMSAGVLFWIVMHGVNYFINYFYSNCMVLFILDLEEAHKVITLIKFMNCPVIRDTHWLIYIFICLLYFIVGREFSTGSGKWKSERTVWEMSWWGKVAKKGCSYLVLQWNE